MNMATNDQTVFSSLSDILMQNSETIDEWYSTLPGGILLGLSTAIIILIIVSSVLGWKMHRMPAIVMTLSKQSRTANADAELDLGETRKRDGPLIFVRSTTMATTQPSLQDVILSAIAWRDMVLYIIAATVMLLAVCMLVKCCIQCYRKAVYTVALRLTDGREIVMLNLITLKGKRWHVHYTESLHEIRCIPGLFPKVILYWPSIQIVSSVDKHRFKVIEMQRTFIVSRKVALKLTRILKTTFTCQPLMLHNGKVIAISMCNEQCNLISRTLASMPTAPEMSQGRSTYPMLGHGPAN